MLKQWMTRNGVGKIRHALAWTAGGAFGSRAIALGASAVVARTLGRDLFGAVNLMNVTAGAMQAVTGLGLGVAVTKLVAEHRATSPARCAAVVGAALRLSIVVGACAALIVVVAGEYIATAMHTPELAPLIRISALTLPLASTWGVQTGALCGLQAFPAVALTTFVYGLLTAVGTIVGAWCGGAAGTMWGSIAGNALGSLFAHAVLAERQPGGSAGNASASAMLVRAAAPTYLAGLVVAPTAWASSALLVRQPGGLGEMGLFSAANQWLGALLAMPTVVAQVILPMFSERVASGNGGDTRALLARSVEANAVLGFGLATAMSVGSPWLVRMYGPGFENAAATMCVVVFTAAIVAIQTPVSQLFIAADRQWWAFGANAAWAALTVALTMYCVRWGAFGAAIARLVAYVVHSASLFVVARIVLDINARPPSASWTAGGAERG